MNDASELRQLAHDLSNVPRSAGPKIHAAVSKSALEIKDDWNNNLGSDAASIGSRLSRTSRSVTYEMQSSTLSAFTGLARSVEAEIGPEVGRKRTQGPLAGLFETGGVDGIPQTKPGDRALKANEANFAEYLETAVDEAIRDAL